MTPGSPIHAPLWRVASYHRHQRVPAHFTGFWHDNRGRQPIGSVVFQYTLHGAMRYERHGVEHAVPRHHAALFRYGDDSAYGTRGEEPERYEGRWVMLTGAGLSEHWGALMDAGGAVLACEPEGAVMRLVDQAIDTSEASDDPLLVASVVQDLVLALYAQLQRHRRRDLTPSEQAVERILAMPYHPWSLKELAVEHACSREHLIRTFRARTGEPPATWLRRVRLDRALHLLTDSRMPMADVARQSGFTSTHTLARLVRAHTGRAPTDLRPS